jgi:glycosyltransferase involved in cell wall biosynthesis
MLRTTIVIPCFNYAKYLPETIESVKNQTEKCQIIVVDDASTDNTYEVAQKYKVAIIRHNKNRGLAAARNSGIRYADTEWVFPLDADDLLVETCIEKLHEEQELTKADILSPGLQEFGERTNYQFPGEELTLEGFKKANQIHASALFRKDMWITLEGYDESMREGYEDWDFWLRALKKGYKVATFDEPLFFYRIHADSMVNQTKLKHEQIKVGMLKKLGLDN